MKLNKKTKILLVSIVIVVFLAIVGICVGIEFGNSNNTETATLVEGSGEYDWVKYDVHIVSSSYTDSGQYYTHCDDDCVYNVYFYGYKGYLRIKYATYFSIFDDMDVMFVISSYDNSYELTSHVERTHTPLGGDSVDIDDPKCTGCGSHYIKEIWVRTVD